MGMAKDATAGSPDHELQPRVFISYSRADQAFAQRLAGSLEAHGFSPDWDQASFDPDSVATGISAEDEWWTRLQEMIASADTMVFIVSPDSARSRICDEEIAYARALGKRVIPVSARPIDFEKAPPRLAALNVKIAFDGSAGTYEEAVEQLTRALLVDVRWMRELARLSLLARRWDDSTREPDRLLLGDELRLAEEWAAGRPASAPAVPQLILEYLSASRGLDAERRAITEVERIRYEEIQHFTLGLLEEELDVRKAWPLPDHEGAADEERTERDVVAALVGQQTRWHPKPARHRQSTGATEGYAEIFGFPCCDLHVRDFRSGGKDDPPSQFRADGCEQIPASIQYEPSRRANTFSSRLVRERDAFRVVFESLFESGMAGDMVDALAETAEDAQLAALRLAFLEREYQRWHDRANAD
jgi:hypothetical protein